ncbi:fructose-bisphosphate aldolase, class II [Selenomonas ruminantium]|uniref:Fructose-bisphosphate aldolase, class II n=1 Tax=Selenomonas ruminantium TaxID=971 RepID=A0A1M6XKJ8_SELRU|nr:class II fructose-bisphosphate aldolase [Selenomonas ruminantium]SHL06345.1 fructose-bisphosphate aldolase, class II [Selenomonas ruminantium]
MLINLRDMLTLAEEKNCAIGSFNVYNVESLQAVLKAAKNKAAPVIVSLAKDRRLMVLC